VIRGPRTNDAAVRSDAGSSLFLRLVLPFLLTLSCLFGISVAGMTVLSAVRAYVGGEALWSKAQKEAVYHLIRYASSHDRDEFDKYRVALSVPEGDRKARVELDKPEPDYALARQGFLEGRNDPADVDGMIGLFRRLRHVALVDRSIAIWEEADVHIAELSRLADRLQAEVERTPPDRVRIDAALAAIDREAGILTPLEDAFSYSFGQAAREVGRWLLALLALATVLLTTCVVWFCRVVLRERERHQQALRESEERYRTFFETSIDAVILGRPDGVVEAVNAAACRMFGFDASEPGGGAADAFRDSLFDSIRSAMAETVQSGRFGGQSSFSRRDGTTFDGEVAACLFTDSSGHQKTSVVVRDISARLRAEQEIRRLNATLEGRVAARTAELEAANRELLVFNRELESFCYSVSHDLRLPLRSMNGFSQLLLSDYGAVLDMRGQNYLQSVQRACRRMGRLIDDLLNLSRYTRQKLVPQVLDLRAIAEEVIDELRAEHPGGNVEVDISMNGHSTTCGDGTLVRVLLRHLLANAWKFSAGTERPRIEFAAEADGGEAVYFVRDNGCGFDMAYADKLFRIFNRLHAVDEFEGTGIGLSIVQRIVMRHGGRVWAQSVPQQGATFYFTLGASGEAEMAASA